MRWRVNQWKLWWFGAGQDLDLTTQEEAVCELSVLRLALSPFRKYKVQLRKASQHFLTCIFVRLVLIGVPLEG